MMDPELYMQEAIAEAQKADSVEDAPLVGVVAVKGDQVLGRAHRGELGRGEHAEYILLNKILPRAELSGSTIYTTLEPCSARRYPKPSCAAALAERKVQTVVIGMLDPNPYLSGRGINLLRTSGVDVKLFPNTLMARVSELNASFAAAWKDVLPPQSVHISGYEWDLLETEGDVAGRTQRGWYEYFVAHNDLSNLSRLLTFYTPPPDESQVTLFDVPAAEQTTIVVPTDIRIIQSVTKDPQKILSLTPREFELFTAELLEKLGYSHIVIGQGSKDHGVDVTAYIEHALGLERVIVQCKRHKPENKVGEPIIKQLLADTDLHKAARGLMVTTSYLTRDARLLVEAYNHRLSALEYPELSRVLKKIGS